VPVVGLGVATRYAPARDVMLVFVAIVVVALVTSLRAVIGPRSTRRTAAAAARGGLARHASP